MTTTTPPQPRSAASWKETALAKSEMITDAWEVTKTYAGRIAEWVLFGCMIMNIIQILPGVALWPSVSNIVLGTQVVMLDVGGFSLASMGDQARQQGDERAARRASVTGALLIGIMILTLLLVSIGLLWPAATSYTSTAEKGLILVRVIMTVIYGHVIHGLRRVGTQREHAALTEHFTEQLERKFGEHPTHSEHAHLTETVQAHTQTLAELAALPGLFERLQQAIQTQVHTVVQQEMKAAMESNTDPRRKSVPHTERPKLSVVEANSEHQTPKERTRRANSTESDKGAFVRQCLTETPNMRNTDIQRKAAEQGITISPAHISEIRKAFLGEQTA